MFFDDTLVQLVKLETESNLPTYAVRTIGRLEWFEFDNATEFTIKEYLCLNRAAEGYYQVVGENESGFDEVKAVIYFRPRTENKKYAFKMMFPDDETKKILKDWAEPKKIVTRCSNANAKTDEVSIAEYAPKEYKEMESEEVCSTTNTTE